MLAIVEGMNPRFAPLTLLPLILGIAAWGQQPAVSAEEQAVRDRLRKLRSLSDEEWTRSVAELASQIHSMPAGAMRQRLIGSLVNLSTEGDAGLATLQMIADTVVEVVKELPADKRSSYYESLAGLVRFEHVRVTLDDPQFPEALKKLDAAEERIKNADFTLKDLQGKAWTLGGLRGKVVLVNFWATWCPPCRREMPDMQALHERLGPRGLVVLAISDEDAAKVQEFIAEKKYTYPILLDPDKKVHELFSAEGIPKSFVFDREGKLVATAMDRRTMGQFVAMLKAAGLE